MRSSFLLSAVLVSLPLAHSQPPADKGRPSTAKLGQKIPNLTFHDETDKAFSLYDIKDRKAIVIVFLSFECPVSTSYCDSLANMHNSTANRSASSA